MRKFLRLLYPFVNTTKKRLFSRPKARQRNEDQENVTREAGADDLENSGH